MFLNRKVRTQQQQNKNQTFKPLPEPGIESGPIAPKSDVLPLHYLVN